MTARDPSLPLAGKSAATRATAGANIEFHQTLIGVSDALLPLDD